MRTLLFVVICLCLLSAALFSQSASSDSTVSEDVSLIPLSFDDAISLGESRSEFYQGLSLFQAGNIPQAILAFQNAVALFTGEGQDEFIYKFWLAKAHYAYGTPQISEVIWRELINADFIPSYLRNRIELLQLQQSEVDFLDFTQLGQVSSIDLEANNLALPMTLRKFDGGSFGLTAIRSNVVAIIQPTGAISRYLAKNYGIFGIPTDIVKLRNGTMLISEFKTNSISKFSSTGTYDGAFILEGEQQNQEWDQSFLGPQYMSSDAFDNVYSTVYGTGEVVKFTHDGKFVLRFGKETSAFAGLYRPTGIQVLGDSVWVAHQTRDGAELVRFDSSGNYLETVPLYGRGMIESLRMVNDTIMLITFHDVVVKFDVEKQVVLQEFSDSSFMKLTSAELDANRLLWVADQERNTIDLFSNISSLYTGLNVQTLRVDTSEFPQVRFVFSVRDSLGGKITGLDADSFSITEGSQQVSPYVLQESRDIPRNDYIYFVQGRNVGAIAQEHLKDSISRIAQQAAAGSSNEKSVVFSLISPSPTLPVLNISNTTSPARVIATLGESESRVSSDQDLHRALMFASNLLMTFEGRKSIVFIGDGAITQDDERTENIAAILAHHNIRLFWVDTSGVPSQEIEPPTRTHKYLQFLIEKSEGNQYRYPFIIQGRDDTIINEIFAPQYGEYVVDFTSQFALGNAERYVPVIITGFFYTSSGQDISAYLLPNVD